jgi:RNA polymerase sigma-70 factor (ECF subfamily)
MDGDAERIAATFREEWGRIMAGLIRFSGSFDLAEEALQEAFALAVEVWPRSGHPENAGAWITTAARRKLIDALRREKVRRDKSDALMRDSPMFAPPDESVFSMQEWPNDDRLRLIFTCCHPALALEAQIALTLRTLGGLTTAEIARAFLLPEATLAQRIVRAKRKIQDARIPYEVPGRERLPERLDAVRHVLYLIFNEGYAAAFGDELTRGDLCREAIRLARVLCDLMPGDRENAGLLALMLLQDSRRLARRGRSGELITLEEQDRSLWDAEQIRAALVLLASIPANEERVRFELEARIAAEHARAGRAGETDWRRIASLYSELLHLNPSPVIALNEAVAVAMAEGIPAGLARMDQIAASGDLDEYYLLHAARADLLRRLGRNPEAAEAYRKALDLVTNETERRYLKQRLHSVSQ